MKLIASHSGMLGFVFFAKTFFHGGTLNRGKDFRCSFSLLGGLRALTTAPFLALTASAPPSIVSEIAETLHFTDPVNVFRPLNRPNIFLSASRSTSISVSCVFLTYFTSVVIFSLQRDLSGLTSRLKSQHFIPKTLIFCKTKDVAYSILSGASSNRTSVGLFHASLTPSTKEATCESFRKSTIQVLAATVAFGMVRRISKADISIFD